MLNFIEHICGAPVAVFILSWSAIIGIGEYYFKSKRITLVDELKQTIRSYSEQCAKMLLMFAFIYTSALLLATMSSEHVRWVVLALCFAGIMLCFIRIAATTEYTMKHLPKEWRSLSLPILLIDAITMLSTVFGAFWMAKVFFALT